PVRTVARVAGGGIRQHFSRIGQHPVAAGETEVRPLIGKALLVLHLELHRRNGCLETAALVDRPLACRLPALEREDWHIGPFARRQKSAISIGMHKHGAEPRLIVWSRVRPVSHSQAGTEKYPLAVIGRADQFALRRKLRPGRGGGKRKRSQQYDRAEYHPSKLPLL